MSAAIASHRIAGETALRQGRVSAALGDFKAASDLDPALAYHEYWALALKLNRQYSEALAAYQTMAQRPAIGWMMPLDSPPGACGKAVSETLELCRLTGSAPDRAISDLASRMAAYAGGGLGALTSLITCRIRPS